MKEQKDKNSQEHFHHCKNFYRMLLFSNERFFFFASVVFTSGKCSQYKLKFNIEIVGDDKITIGNYWTEENRVIFPAYLVSTSGQGIGRRRRKADWEKDNFSPGAGD